MIGAKEKVERKKNTDMAYFCLVVPPGYIGPHVHLSPCGHMFNRNTVLQDNLCVECFPI